MRSRPEEVFAKQQVKSVCTGFAFSCHFLSCSVTALVVNRTSEGSGGTECEPYANRRKRGQAESPNPLKSLVGHAGIEPATS